MTKRCLLASVCLSLSLILVGAIFPQIAYAASHCIKLCTVCQCQGKLKMTNPPKKPTCRSNPESNCSDIGQVITVTGNCSLWQLNGCGGALVSSSVVCTCNGKNKAGDTCPVTVNCP